MDTNINDAKRPRPNPSRTSCLCCQAGTPLLFDQQPTPSALLRSPSLNSLSFLRPTSESVRERSGCEACEQAQAEANRGIPHLIVHGREYHRSVQELL